MRLREVEIVAAVQECSGLIVLARIDGGEPEWIRPPERGVSREMAELLIEEAKVAVAGRMP